jgi:hypothetical protein
MKKQNINPPDTIKVEPDDGPFYHGTKAALDIGEEIRAGFQSNYLPHIRMNHVYFTATLSAAALAAELAAGEATPKVYEVIPLGPFEDDPNVTNQRFQGNPTRSYRSQSTLRIIREVNDWPRLNPEEKLVWQNRIERMRQDPSTKIYN